MQAKRRPYVKPHSSPSHRPRPRRHAAGPPRRGHSPHPPSHRRRGGAGRGGAARHGPPAVQSAAGGGPAPRHPLRYHLQRSRGLGPRRGPHERSLQPLLERRRAPHHRTHGPHRPTHAGGAGAGGLCTLYGIPRRPERLLRRPHLPRPGGHGAVRGPLCPAHRLHRGWRPCGGRRPSSPTTAASPW